jgi:hypothetical protein
MIKYFISAIVVVTSACNPCSLDVEVSRILAAQENVTQCGTVRSDSPRSELSLIVECMTNAIGDRRPFRAFANGLRGTETVFLGRRVGDDFEVQAVAATLPAPIRVTADVCRNPSFMIVVQSEGNTGSLISWQCAEHQGRMLPSQPAYNPPRIVPVGQICPVL